MLPSYVLSSLLTLSLTYSWYSFYGARFVFKSKFLERENGERKTRLKAVPVVPIYMWDIYNNGANSSEFDVIKGIHPKFIGSSFKSHLYRNRRKKQLEFNIPDPNQNEILIKAEIRITTTPVKNHPAYFQIYLKSDKWIFLDEKKVSGVDITWISLQVSPKILKPGRVTFLILSLFQNPCTSDGFSHPILLLSYVSRNKLVRKNSMRKKRNLGVEDYEEKTNRIWGDEIPSQGVTTRMRNSCRRKSLYIEFSEIDYDSWIVAPSGYDAFQCVGKCTFPVSEHLSPTKHAILQTLLHNISPWKASRACCVPTRLDPISILYVDEKGILTYRFRYQDMVVAECGCR